MKVLPGFFAVQVAVVTTILGLSFSNKAQGQGINEVEVAIETEAQTEAEVFSADEGKIKQIDLLHLDLVKSGGSGRDLFANGSGEPFKNSPQETSKLEGSSVKCHLAEQVDELPSSVQAIVKLSCPEDDNRCSCLNNFFAQKTAMKNDGRKVLLQAGYQYQLNKLFDAYSATVRANLSVNESAPGNIMISTAADKSPLSCQPSTVFSQAMKEVEELTKKNNCLGDKHAFTSAIQAALGETSNDFLQSLQKSNAAFTTALKDREVKSRFYYGLDQLDRQGDPTFVDCINPTVKKALAMAPISYPLGSLAKYKNEHIGNTLKNQRDKSLERAAKLNDFVLELERWSNNPSDTVQQVVYGNDKTKTYYRQMFQVFPGLENLLEIYSQKTDDPQLANAKLRKKKQAISGAIRFFKMLASTDNPNLHDYHKLRRTMDGVLAMENFIHDELNKNAIGGASQGYQEQVEQSCKMVQDDLAKIACSPPAFIHDEAFMKRSFGDAVIKKQMPIDYVPIWACDSTTDNDEVTNMCASYDLAKCADRNKNSSKKFEKFSKLPDFSSEQGNDGLSIFAEAKELLIAEEGAVLHVCKNWNQYLRDERCSEFKGDLETGDRTLYRTCATKDRMNDSSWYQGWMREAGIDPAKEMALLAMERGLGGSSNEARVKTQNSVRTVRTNRQASRHQSIAKTSPSQKSLGDHPARVAHKALPAFAPRPHSSTPVASSIDESIAETKKDLVESDKKVAQAQAGLDQSPLSNKDVLNPEESKELADLRRTLAEMTADNKKIREELAELEARKKEKDQEQLAKASESKKQSSSVTRAPASVPSSVASFPPSDFRTAAIDPNSGLADTRFSSPPIQGLNRLPEDPKSDNTLTLGVLKVPLKSISTLDVASISNEAAIKALILEKVGKGELKVDSNNIATLELVDEKTKELRVVIVRVDLETQQVSFLETGASSKGIARELEQKMSQRLNYAQLLNVLKNTRSTTAP